MEIIPEYDCPLPLFSLKMTTFINEKRVGKGTLYISEARVTWCGDASANNHTFSLEYNHISLHAISRDLMVFPHTECLYMMIDTKLVDSEPSTPVSTPGRLLIALRERKFGT